MTRKRLFGPEVEPSGIFSVPLYFFSFIGSLLISSRFGLNETTLAGTIILLIVSCFIYLGVSSEHTKTSYFGGRFLVVILPVIFIIVGFSLGIYK